MIESGMGTEAQERLGCVLHVPEAQDFITAPTPLIWLLPIVSSAQHFSRDNLACFLRNPHCGILIYADGHGKVWTDWDAMSELFQDGW